MPEENNRDRDLRTPETFGAERRDARENMAQMKRVVFEALRNLVSPIRTNRSIQVTGKGRLKIPVFATNPDSCEKGEVAVIGGVLKVCTAEDTWSAVTAITGASGSFTSADTPAKTVTVAGGITTEITT